MRLLTATGNAIAIVEGDGESSTATFALEGTGAQCVASDPVRPNTVFAGCQGRGVWRSEDGGRTWEDCGLPAPDVFSIAVSPADGAVYAGCEPSMLFVSHDAGDSWHELETLKEIPSAPTWSFPPRPWTSHVRWIAPSPHDGALLLVGIELGGVMRSEDGGDTWQDHRPGAKLDAHALAWHPSAPGRAYEAAGDGSAWSVDGGLTWEPTDTGRDRNYVWGLAVDPLDPDTWFVSAAPSPFKAHGSGPAEAFLYRWRAHGPWEPVNGGLAGPLDVLPTALAAGPDELYVGMRDGRVFLSEDLGDTWRRLEVRGAIPRILALEIAPTG